MVTTPKGSLDSRQTWFLNSARNIRDSDRRSKINANRETAASRTA